MTWPTDCAKYLSENGFGGFGRCQIRLDFGCPVGEDMRLGKRLKKKGEYWLVQSLFGLARLLPRRAGQRFFGGLGTAGARLLSSDRRRAVENLGVAFPEAPEMIRAAMARAMFKSLGRNLYEFLRLEGASAETLAERVERVVGMDNYLTARARGRGVIGITGHIGCWELTPAYFVSRGYPVSAVARRMQVNRLNERLVDIRRSVGVVTLDRDESPRAMIKVLKRGEILAVLIDQHTRVAGVYVPFFNRPALTPTAVAKIALMTGAPIVPMAIFMNARGKHEVHVLPAIEPGIYTGKRDDVVAQLTADCSTAVERLIRIDPKQWVWFHNRWREPEGAEAVYAVQN